MTRRSLREQFAAIYPTMGPWTEAALWHGLLDTPPPHVPLGAELDIIRRQRLAPLLLGYISAHDLTINGDELRQLQRSAFDWTVFTHRVLDAGLPIVRALIADGIPCAVSKGPALAALYPQQKFRPHSDLDVLVSPEHFRKAKRLLMAAGYEESPESRPPWPYFDRWCREGINLKNRKTGGSIDLHHHVPPWLPAADLSTTALISRSTAERLDIPLLDAEDNLLVAALHVISDRNLPGRTLLAWRDVIQCARLADPELLSHRCRQHSLTDWVAALLSQVCPTLLPRELQVLFSGSGYLKAGHRLHRSLDPALTGRSVVVKQPLRLPLPSAILYLMGMLLPSPQFVRTKCHTRTVARLSASSVPADTSFDNLNH